MKESKLDCGFSYCKKYYITHPLKLTKEIYSKIKGFIHRGKYGYAYVDVWNWYDWWTKVGANALRYLAERGCGYSTECNSMEEWQDYLNNLADKLDWCRKSCEIGCHEDRNEYSKYRKEICAKKGNTTAEDQKILEKYWQREEELVKEDDNTRAEIFAEIGRNLPKLWD